MVLAISFVAKCILEPGKYLVFFYIGELSNVNWGEETDRKGEVRDCIAKT